MLKTLWRQFFIFEGRIRRGPYAIIGVSLVVLKFAVDSFITSRFGQPWKIWNYVVPPNSLSVFGFGTHQPRLYLILWAFTLPFFWAGISLTTRRLRDAGLPLALALIFFAPVANFGLFLLLMFVPSKPAEFISPKSEAPPASQTSSWSIAGVVIAALLGLLLTAFSANFLLQYAWGLFLGVPFVTGFVATWIACSTSTLSARAAIVLSACVPIVIGFALIGFRMEGLVCLVMAIPLALPLSIAGGLIARTIILSQRASLSSPRLSACVAILPLMMCMEHVARLDPPVRPVITSVIINAPSPVVWKNVVAFPPLALPKEWIFHTGIAYPLGATIMGSGPGAIRRCRFSTGDFVEPITTWDENHLLAFSVASQPPSLQEIGFGDISTPHVSGSYIRSQHGQFRLIAINDHQTELEGTTWYQDYFWPQFYWRPISDAIVHRIHQRVLDHVKVQAESQAQQVPLSAQ